MDKLTHAIIDADHVVYIATHKKKIQIGLDGEGLPIYQKDDTGKFVYEDKTLKEVKESVDIYLNDILFKSGAEFYVGFAYGKSLTRHEINPEYKANRTRPKPMFFEEALKHMCLSWNIIDLSGGGLETDDVVATTKATTENSFIISPDKDLLYLEGTHYNPRTNAFFTVSAEDAHQAFWTSMITGDTADNIAGIPGKGIKFAQTVFPAVTPEQYPNLVFQLYWNHFKAEAPYEFYRNYECLRIRTNEIPVQHTFQPFHNISHDISG